MTDTSSSIVDVTDGRRVRSQESKQKIVHAMLELVRDGNVSPTAEEVAQKADVGLRTLFRRFKDMESLYAEMSIAIKEKVAPLIDEPLSHQHWWENLHQLVDRRAKVYEIIMPYRVAAEALKFQSTVLSSHHSQIVYDEREKLLAVVPENMLYDRPLIEALQAALSFDMWNQLRNDQRLSAAEAGEVVQRMIRGLLPHPPYTN